MLAICAILFSACARGPGGGDGFTALGTGGFGPSAEDDAAVVADVALDTSLVADVDDVVEVAGDAEVVQASDGDAEADEDGDGGAVSPPLDVIVEPPSDGESDSGGIVVADGGPGPILGGGDKDVVADVAVADGGTGVEDVGAPGVEVSPSEPDVADEEIPSVEPDVDEPEPDPTCTPNPCQQAAPPSCAGAMAQALFVPGVCSIVNGEPVCDHAAQAMDCGQAGGSCVTGQCQGSPPSPEKGELVVVEVMRNPAPAHRQWLELLVVADGPRNLAGCGVADGGSSVFVLPPEPHIVQPGEFVLIAEVEPTNDGVSTPDAAMPVGALDLLADGRPLIVNCMGTLVDVVDYTTGTPWQPFPSTPAVAMQVSPGSYSADANDLAKAWCDAPDPYTFATYGSPGTPNPTCNADVDRCMLWSPAYGSAVVGGELVASAIVFDQGITDLTVVGPDPTPDLQGQLGLGPDDANPALSPDDFVWFDATPQDFPPAGVGSIEDYYEATLLPDTAGVFDLAARFTPDQGLTWLYCDLDGSVNGYEVDQAGHVQVNSAQ